MKAARTSDTEAALRAERQRRDTSARRVEQLEAIVDELHEVSPSAVKKTTSALEVIGWVLVGLAALTAIASGFNPAVDPQLRLAGGMLEFVLNPLMWVGLVLLLVDHYRRNK